MLTAALLGALVGLVLALTGAGGGALAVPLLVFGLHLGMAEAAPTALLAVGASALVGSLVGLREGNLRYRAAGLIGVVGIGTAPLGVALAQRLPERFLLLASAAVLGWTAWRMAGLRLAPARAAAAAPPPCRVDRADGRLRWTAPCAWALGSVGVVAGLLGGLLGVGGGFVIVPALTRLTDLDPRSIVATSLGVVTLVSIGALAAAGHQGSLPGAVALPFGLAAVVALLAGRRLARRLPPQATRRSFAGVALLVGLMMLARAALRA